MRLFRNPGDKGGAPLVLAAPIGKGALPAPLLKDCGVSELYMRQPRARMRAAASSTSSTSVCRRGS
jgi:hypothetical protein